MTPSLTNVHILSSSISAQLSHTQDWMLAKEMPRHSKRPKAEGTSCRATVLQETIAVSMTVECRAEGVGLSGVEFSGGGAKGAVQGSSKRGWVAGAAAAQLKQNLWLGRSQPQPTQSETTLSSAKIGSGWAAVGRNSSKKSGLGLWPTTSTSQGSILVDLQPILAHCNPMEPLPGCLQGRRKEPQIPFRLGLNKTWTTPHGEGVRPKVNHSEKNQ